MSYEPFKMKDLEGLELSSFSQRETEGGHEVLPLVMLSQLIWTVRRKGKILSIVGCHSATLLGSEAFLWCITTREMERIGAAAMLYHIRIVDNLREKFHHIQGVVLPDCKRWVEMLGFEVGPEVNEGYHTFDWRR